MGYKLFGKEYKTAFELAVENILLERSAGECIAGASVLPAPVALMGGFWQEGELALLVGDSRAGKSVLAVQVADGISKGLPLLGLESGLSNTAEPQKVLYFDFDTGDKYFESRYTDALGVAYCFSDLFVRVVIQPAYNEHKNMGQILYTAMENMIQKHGAKVVVADSITGLMNLSYHYTGQLYDIAVRLKRLKTKYNLSVLMVADTGRDNRGRRIAWQNMGGIRKLAGMANSVFALGINNRDEGLRYLLPLKNNTGNALYNDRQVPVYRIGKKDAFTCLEYTGISTERHQIQRPPDALEQAIIAMHENEPLLTMADIANKLCTYKMKVKRVLDSYEAGKQAQTPVALVTKITK